MKRLDPIFVLVTLLCLLPAALLNAQITYSRYFGGPHDDMAYSVIQTSDSGYAVAGLKDYYSTSIFPKYEMYGKIFLMKADKYGDTLWTRTYYPHKLQYAESLLETDEGGFLISGYGRNNETESAFHLLVRTDLNGDTLWTRTLGKRIDSDRRYLIKTKDGGYALSGLFEDGRDSLFPGIIKLDKDGSVKWKKIYSQFHTSLNSGITETSDNGFIMALNGSALLKTDSEGNPLWCRYPVPRDSTMPKGGSHFDIVKETQDHGFMLLGYRELKYKYYYSDYLTLIRTGSEGDTLWTKVFYDHELCYPYSCESMTDGSLIIAGKNGRYAFISKLDPSGNEVWMRDFRKEQYRSSFFSVKRTFDGGLIAAGSRRISDTSYSDILIMKTDEKGNLTSINEDEHQNNIPDEFTLEQNYPNPFNPSTMISYRLDKSSNVELSVYDILGKIVTTLTDKFQTAGKYSVSFNIRSVGPVLQSGIYFYVLRTDHNFAVRKMTLLK